MSLFTIFGGAKSSSIQFHCSSENKAVYFAAMMVQFDRIEDRDKFAKLLADFVASREADLQQIFE